MMCRDSWFDVCSLQKQGRRVCGGKWLRIDYNVLLVRCGAHTFSIFVIFCIDLSHHSLFILMIITDTSRSFELIRPCR